MADTINLLKYDILKDVTHCFTTRTGGVSKGAQTSLNLSFSREKSADNVSENYRRVSKALGVDYYKMTRVPQKHTSNVLKITENLIGIGISKEFPEGIYNLGYDAMITDIPEVVLCTAHADCVPILIYDETNRAIAAVHSGWRGTAGKIALKTVQALQTEYFSKPQVLKAVIGPSIGIDNFETDIDVIDALKASFKEKFFDYSSKYIYEKINCNNQNKYHVSVSGFVFETLLEAGLKKENIYIDELCTFNNDNLFFSHRRDKGDTGVMAAVISLGGDCSLC